MRRIVEERATLPDTLAEGIKGFVDDVLPVDAAGQVQRVARRFALVGVAGELATHYGLTGWDNGEAIGAAKRCFDSWLEAFGGSGNREERNVLSQVRAFFEGHGASRFEDVNASGDQRDINRAGFYRTGQTGDREFLVLPEAFRRDGCAGFDVRVATAALIEAGWLDIGKDGKTAQKPRIPAIGTTRCYVLTAKLWEGE